MSLWDLTTVGLGGTETSDNSNVLSSDVCYILLLCTNYSHLESMGHKRMKATMTQRMNRYLCKGEDVNSEIQNSLKVECNMYLKVD